METQRSTVSKQLDAIDRALFVSTLIDSTVGLGFMALIASIFWFVS